jgi:hypothetical protein
VTGGPNCKWVTRVDTHGHPGRSDSESQPSLMRQSVGLVGQIGMPVVAPAWAVTSDPSIVAAGPEPASSPLTRSASTTLDIYAHYTEPADRRASEMLASSLDGRH